jgi:hypothetical protein
VLEFDADVKGAQFLAGSILDTWSNLPFVVKTDVNLKKLIVVSLVGALSFFIMVLDFPLTGIYYNEKTHPHPLIRMMWISKSLVDALKEQRPDIDNQDVINETLRVLNVYSKHKNLGNIRETYIDPYIADFSNIAKYMYSLVEISRTPGYEFLAK